MPCWHMHCSVGHRDRQSLHDSDGKYEDEHYMLVLKYQAYNIDTTRPFAMSIGR